MKSAVLTTGRKLVARTIVPSYLGAKADSTAGRSLPSLVMVIPLGTMLALSAWLAPRQIGFKQFGAGDIAQLLTILLVVAVFAERALEIFIGTWRGPRAAELAHDVEERGAQLTALDKAAPRDEPAVKAARAALEDARRQEQQYRCVTRQVALWTGLALGLLISGVGFRALGALIDPALLDPQVTTWSARQLAAVNVVDVILTGGVIAGGSEGIHRLATVFDNFMTSTAKLAKGRGSA
jgi:hypothetical protein